MSAQGTLAIRLPANPIIKLEVAQAALGLSTEQIMSLIEVEKKIAWAWDIGLGEKRKEVRLLTRSVRGYQTTEMACGLADWTSAQIIEEVLRRETRPWIEGVHFCHLLSCENKLMLELVRNELAVLPGTVIRPGPDGSPKIARTSVVEFLKRRRIR